jgi:DNA-binding response OmpR family regulator
MATILVVEEDDVLRGHMRRILEAAAHQVYAVHNGLQALLVCNERAGEIEVLVTSQLLADMRGRELHCLAQASQPGVPILMTDGASEGENDPIVLRKPFTADQLLERVRCAIS